MVNHGNSVALNLVKLRLSGALEFDCDPAHDIGGGPDYVVRRNKDPR
jgi:hypothetical protein